VISGAGGRGAKCPYEERGKRERESLSTSLFFPISSAALFSQPSTFFNLSNNISKLKTRKTDSTLPSESLASLKLSIGAFLTEYMKQNAIAVEGEEGPSCLFLVLGSLISFVAFRGQKNEREKLLTLSRSLLL
jgi:hypothetical protein